MCPSLLDGAGAEKGFGGFVRHTSFEDLVADSDVLTFHCDLNDTSRSMLNMDTLPSSDHPVRSMNLTLAVSNACGRPLSARENFQSGPDFS